MDFSKSKLFIIFVSCTEIDRMEKKTGIKTFLKKSGKVLIWTAVIWTVLLAAAQAILSSGVTEKIISKYSEEYIDGNIHMGELKVSMFRNFPNIGLSVDRFSITYPSGKFAGSEDGGPQSHLTCKGKGAESDTLAAFDRFAVSVNLLSLAAGKINIPFAELTSPRIYAHRYHDGRANWNIIKPLSGDGPVSGTDEEEESEESGSMPQLRFGRIGMSRHPHIVYTDCRDTLFAVADLKQVRLNGNPSRIRRQGIRMDSLFVAGRTAGDTIAFGMERFSVRGEGDMLKMHAKANAMLATRLTGRMRIPVEIGSSFRFPERDFSGVDIQELNASVASVPVKGSASLRFMTDRMSVKGGVEIPECNVQEVMDKFVKRYIPDLEGISTDAVIALKIDCDGDYVYAEKSLPSINASISIPDSKVRLEGIDNPISMRMEASASTSDGKLGAYINQMNAECRGLELKLKAGSDDILESDPQISMDGKLDINLKELRTFLPDSADMTAGGQIHARINGKLKSSHLDIYSFSQADINGEITGDSIILHSPSDSVDIDIDRIDITLGPETKVSQRDNTRKFQMMAVKGNTANMSVSYGTICLKGEELSINVMNSAQQHDTTDIGVLGGRINAKKLTLNDSYGTELQLKGTRNGFQMLPKRDHPDLPVLTFTSTNDQIVMKDAVNRAILTDAEIRASAVMNTVERRQRAREFMDSIARRYPDVPRDSLMVHLRRQAMNREVPEWLKEEDFRKNDINIKLDKTLAKYFREWDLNGKIDIRTGILMTPYFPQRNILRGFEIKFDNDRIQIDSAKVRSGASEIGAKGKLTGLSRALLGRGGLKLDLDIYSDKVNANELLAAYSAGSRFTPPSDKAQTQDVSNAEFFKMVTADTVSVKDSVTPLIVIPSNLTAVIRLDASDITYSDLSISSLKSRMVMKERCVQLTGTEVTSNAGNIDFEGFYSTRTKKDIKAGFSLNFKDITAEKVIGLVPAVDTLMPLLKSFNGLLNCELAATAGIDTSMNIIPSSINGVIRIGGKDLSITNSEMFRDLAKKLMFRNKNEGHIDAMSVEGIISDSTIEVFPFVVKLDRYTIALSGIQNMDESFRYHASLIRSPFLIRLGIDMYGDSFDKMKFKVGKAKYKNTSVPVFSAVIDTTKINLVNSIRGIFEKGVDAAVSENERRDAIEKHKKDIGYVRAVDQKLEELSDKEQKQLQDQESVMKETEEAEAKLAETIRQIKNTQEK